MSEWVKYIETFGEELDFPNRAIETLQAAYHALAECDAFPWWEALMADYEAGEDPDWQKMLARLSDVAEELDLSSYTLHLLAFVLLSRPLWDRYQKADIPYPVWRSSMEDLRCKLEECEALHGVVGTFVAPWISRFFVPTCYGLGRLEFEAGVLSRAWLLAGCVYPTKTPVIKVHIPSKGKLCVEDCKAAFSRAVAFYRARHPELVRDGKLLFTCHSWLLDPRLASILPPTSNILKFASLFHIMEATQAEKNDCMWRIYGRDYRNAPADLPRDTALRRAYADFLAAGNLPGEGYGLRIEQV